jgi:hypothetical protein
MVDDKMARNPRLKINNLYTVLQIKELIDGIDTDEKTAAILSYETPWPRPRAHAAKK